MTERRDSAPGAPPPFGGEPAASRPRLAGLLPNAGPSRRVPTAFALALAITLGCGAAYLAYAAARAWVQDRPEFRLDPSAIELTPAPPEAVRGGRETILRAVREAGGLSEPIRLLHPDFEAIRRAFALHSPWVAAVERVDASRPGRLIVRLDYRRPVARVSLEGGGRELVLARDAAVLPAAEVEPETLARLPAIRGLRPLVETGPGLLLGADDTGHVDPGLSGALRLADALAGLPSGVLTILRVADEQGKSVYMILTRRKVWVEWRHAPGDEVAGEPSASAKIERLSRWEQGRGDQPVGSERVLRFEQDGIVLVVRKPVARVSMEGGGREFVLSPDAAVLPAAEVDPEALARLPVIRGLGSLTETGPGLVLGADGSGRIDAGLAGALRLAEALGAFPAGVLTIYRVGDPQDKPMYMVLTRRKVWVEWRHAPGDEVAGEPSASAKIERLSRWEERRGNQTISSKQVLRFEGDGVVLVDGQ